MSEDLRELAPKLTYNAAVTLRDCFGDNAHLNSTIYTGLGKWTTLAAIGVSNTLVALGLATDGEGCRFIATPLGMRLRAWLRHPANFDQTEFREARKTR